jgi:hypothetical protein
MKSFGLDGRASPGAGDSAMDFRRWLWLVLALGLIALGVAIALVTRMPA